MSATRPQKGCRIQGNHLRPCWALDKAFTEYRGKGIRFVQLTSLVTMKPSSSFATLHSGEFVKRGVILNHCPFCGEQISHHVGAV